MQVCLALNNIQCFSQATKQEKSFQSFTQYLEITPTHSIKAKTSDKSLEPNPNAPCTKKSPMNRVKRLFSIETREIIVGDKSKPTKKKPVVEIFNNSQQYKGSTTDPQTFFDEDKETQKNTDSLEERSILKKSPRALDTARREKIRQFIKDNLNRQQQKYNYDEKNRKERNRLQTACSELKRFKNEIKNNSLVPTGDNSHQQKMKQMKNENLNTAVTGLHYEYSNGKKYIFQTSSFDILDVLSQDECIEIRKIKKNPKPITNEKCVKNVSYEINKRGEHLMKNLNPNKQDILTKCIEEKECPRRESTCENKVNESKLRRSKKKVMYFIRKNLF